MKKEFSATLIIAILLTMPIHFLIGFAMIMRGKLPWKKKKNIHPKTTISKKRQVRSKKPIYIDSEISYN